MPDYESIFCPTDDPDEIYMRQLVKAADKRSAYIKCIDEENSGNGEFKTAKESTLKSIDNMCTELPEVRDFMNEFIPAYGDTLDELLR